MPKAKRKTIAFTVRKKNLTVKVQYEKYSLKIHTNKISFLYVILLCLIDCCGSDGVIRGLHQNKAYCV